MLSTGKKLQPLPGIEVEDIEEEGAPVAAEFSPEGGDGVDAAGVKEFDHSSAEM